MVANILVVDDRGENLFAFEELLRRSDRKVYSAGSGREALRLVLEHDFALVLLDLEMPHMNGYETAEIMRSAERSRLIPIIFVTAGDRTDARLVRAYDAGAIDFLFKPINPRVLEAKVELFVAMHLQRRELERTAAALRDRITDLEYVHQTLSHDLRAPIRSIRSFAQVLAESNSQFDESGKDALERVSRAATRLTTMVDDLYSLLRLSADPAEVDSVGLASILGEVLESLRNEIEAAHARITHGVLPRVVANRRLLMQVLQNLISNALRFRSGEAPTVHITAHRNDTAWQVEVRDNGLGIPVADRERVFKLFTRLDTKRSGSGVGLALCARAIDKLGGRIWVAPEPGPGTTLCFTIPDESLQE